MTKNLSLNAQYPLLTLLLLCLGASMSAIHADIIATDGDIPANMNAGGTEVNPADYILGSTGQYNLNFNETVYIGKTTQWNRLIIQNGSDFSTTGTSYISHGSNSQGSVSILGAGSNWTNQNLQIGYDGTGELTISQNGSMSTTSSSHVGYGAVGFPGNGKVTVDGNGSSWAIGSTLHVGSNGTGDLNILNGGHVSSSDGAIGSSNGSVGTINVSGAGSQWVNGFSSILQIGVSGTGNLVIDDGGYVYSRSAYIGKNSTGSGVVTVDGAGSILEIRDNLYFGDNSSQSTMSVFDSALVKVRGDIFDTTQPSAIDNYIRLDGGFIAWIGDNTVDLEVLLSDGLIQVWNMELEAWENAYNNSLFSYGYFATDAEALAFSGYEGLGGYTILTSVPEPEHFAVLAGLMGVLMALRRRK